MKAIENLREWYQSKKGHCDALIKDIVLLGNKGDGEDKEERSRLEETFIDDLETLRGCLERLKTNGDLPSKLQETTTVLEILSNWGLENNDNIIQVIKKIKKSLEKQARGAKEEDIKPSLELLGKQVIGKNTIAVIDFKQIKGILTSRVEEQEKNKNELSIRNENNQQSVYDVVGLRLLIAEFLEDVRDKIIFLFRLNKALAIDSKITGNLNLYRYRDVITSEVFSGLVLKTKVIEKLKLSWCRQITDEGLEALAPYLGKLTSLDVDYIEITDKGLEALAKNCKNLTSLNLSSCEKNMTDEGLAALANNCRNLTSLNLSYCQNITDEGLKALAKSCSNLTSLDLQGGDRITDEGLKAIVRGCPKLKILEGSNVNRLRYTIELEGRSNSFSFT